MSMSARGPDERETWADWLPGVKSDEVTVDELVEMVGRRRNQDDSVSVDQLRYWQKVGVLPQPVKRWHEGATRAFYPGEIAVAVISELLDLQHLGYTLQQIAPRLRAHVQSLLQGDPLNMRDTVVELARRYGELTQASVAKVDIRFTDVDGRAREYTYSTAPESRLVEIRLPDQIDTTGL